MNLQIHMNFIFLVPELVQFFYNSLMICGGLLKEVSKLQSINNRINVKTHQLCNLSKKLGVPT